MRDDRNASAPNWYSWDIVGAHDFREPRGLEIVKPHPPSAPAIQRSSEAQCNGEEYEGQRANLRFAHGDLVGWSVKLEDRIAKRAAQLERRIAKLSEQLRPYGLYAYWQRDPNGAPLYLCPIGHEQIASDFCVGG
jgi:hypothetical protein